MNIQTLPLTSLKANPKNPNVCDALTLDKIESNIKRTNVYPALIVRPDPAQVGTYIILDGHHRRLILERLGKADAICQVWELSESEADLALATLNRLRGTDDLHKRAVLFQSLTATFPPDVLSTLVPETPAEINDLLALVKLNQQAIERSIKAQVEAEKAVLPVPLSFMLTPDGAKIVEAVLTRYKQDKMDRGQALVAACQTLLEMNHGQTI